MIARTAVPIIASGMICTRHVRPWCFRRYSEGTLHCCKVKIMMVSMPRDEKIFELEAGCASNNHMPFNIQFPNQKQPSCTTQPSPDQIAILYMPWKSHMSLQLK